MVGEDAANVLEYSKIILNEAAGLLTNIQQTEKEEELMTMIKSFM